MQNEISKHVVSATDKIAAELAQYDYDVKLSQTFAKAGLVPEAYRGKPENIFFAINYGRSLGLTAIQSMQLIQVIKGKPGLASVGMLGVITPHADKAPKIVHERDKNGNSFRCTCTMYRGGESYTKSFSLDDAKRAGISNNTGWKNYPENMMEWRSISFCARLAFADILAGVYTEDEVQDMQANTVVNQTQKEPVVKNITEKLLEPLPKIEVKKMAEKLINVASKIEKEKRGEPQARKVSKEEAADNTPAPPPKDFTQMIPPDLSDHARHVAEMLCLNATDKVNFNQVLKAAEKDIKAITNVDDYEIVKYLIEKIQAFL